MQIEWQRAFALARLTARALVMGRPTPLSTAQRLANIAPGAAPVRASVEIRWDRCQVPSIHAQSEGDLAVGLGVVHAHLRLAQMELMRRLARGTTAEALGPAAVPFDHALRLMRFGAAADIQAGLPEQTRHWAEGFVAGINHHVARAPALPYTLRLLRITPAPWTLDDLIVVSRLAATDVTWLVFARLLRAQSVRSAAEWDRLWPELQSGDALPWPETPEQAALGLFRGSNSAGVAAAMARCGAGLIASDPHLPITLPPLWLIAGLHAPGLDVVGLMPPGVPVVALGRNPHLAWGGASLHAASSELVDVSEERMTEREERIAVRGAPDAVIRIRETRFGPVVSDGILLRSARPLALRWVGHRPSDELTAMLGVMRARSIAQFKGALGGFAVPGQTMVAVEAGPRGRAARVLAAHLPRRRPGPAPRLVSEPDEVWGFDDLVRAAEWPMPDEAVAIAANDRPAETPVPAGFFFSPPDRAERMRSLLGSAAPVTLAAMRALQLDDIHEGALRLRTLLLPRVPPGRVAEALAQWDGSYGEHSPGALAFEALVAGLARRMLPRSDRLLLSSIWTGRALLARRIAAAPPGVMRAASRDAARALRRLRTWGRAHRMSVRDPLAALPVVGHWFAAPEFGAAGGNETVNKTGHKPVRGRHRVTYGASARHVSDLADPDANWFVLLGGQDGWPGSANFTDQIALWRAGEAIRVPLRHDATRSWPHRTVLDPP